jgi:hypothetical protein
LKDGAEAKAELALQQQPSEVQEANDERAVVAEVVDRPAASFRPSFSFLVPQCAPVDEWQQHEDLDPHYSEAAAAEAPVHDRHRHETGCGDNTPMVVVVAGEMDEQLNDMSVAPPGLVLSSADTANDDAGEREEHVPSEAYNFHASCRYYCEGRYVNSGLGTNHFAAQGACELAKMDDADDGSWTSSDLVEKVGVGVLHRVLA